MRKLTFSGYTKRYVASLSTNNTTSVYKLVREAETLNLRLREPLLLFALSNGCEKTLLAASRNTTMHTEYSSLCAKYSYNELVSALRTEDPSLPSEYLKVWKSYCSVANKQKRDDRVKSRMRERVLELQRETGISVYRICKDLSLNPGNVNDWLKNDVPSRVSLDTARSVLSYLQN